MGKDVKINYGSTFANNYTRDYYKGKSFHYSGEWAVGVHYVNDEYNQDFVVYEQALLACAKSHTSTVNNLPTLIRNESGNITGVESPYWDLVFSAMAVHDYDLDSRITDQLGDSPTKIMSQRGVTTAVNNLSGDLLNAENRLTLSINGVSTDLSNKYLELVASDDALRLIITNALGDISSLNDSTEQKFARINISLDEISTEIGNTRTDLTGIIDSYYTRFTQRADEISLEAARNLQNKIDGITTAYQASISLTAEQIRSEVSRNISDVNGRIDSAFSLINQTADDITLYVERSINDLDGSINTKYSEWLQTAESIRTTVSDYHSDLEGNIRDVRSEWLQTAEEIRSTVSDNKIDADGKIANLASVIDQTAEEIRAEVSRSITDVNGAIDTAKAEIKLTTDAITATVEHNKELADGSIETLSSTITQTASNIRAEILAAKTDVEGTITARVAELNASIDEISSTVASNKTSADGEFDSLSSRITQTETDITSVVSRISTAEGNITTVQSTIQQYSDMIALRVLSSDYDADMSTLNTRLSTIEQTNSSISLSVSNIQSQLSNQSSALSDYATQLSNMQDQIDGVIDTWYYDGTPTLNNQPAVAWDTNAKKNAHLGDLYYDKQNGVAYRFLEDDGTYFWQLIPDDLLTRALAEASEAKDTADSKRRIFTSTQQHPTPYPPYDVGDMWVMGSKVDKSGAILYCINARQTGIYQASDWATASDYTTYSEVKSNFQIFADAIISTVSENEYNENGMIDRSIYSKIIQRKNQISLEIGEVGTNITTGLLNTGINITNGSITLTANKIWLQNQYGQKALTLTEDSNHNPLIDISNLNIEGVFTTSAWTNTIRPGILTEANNYTNTSSTNTFNSAKSYADAIINSLISEEITPLEESIEALDYLHEALKDGDTIIGGGLILSSLIELGSLSALDEWQVWCGLNGIYRNGSTIAAWFGGDMVDKATSPNAERPAKVLFRMNGSGYLASNNVYWDTLGNLTVRGTIIATDLQLDNSIRISASNIAGLTTNQITDFSNSVDTILGTKNYLTEHQDLSDYLQTDTIIENGYIKTGLIDAGAIAVNQAFIGALYAKHLDSADGTFSGSISVNNGAFSVNSSGDVTANTITLRSGVLGGTTGNFTFGSNNGVSYLYSGLNSLTATGNGVYVGTDGIKVGNNFKVTADGTITATGLTIDASQVTNLPAGTDLSPYAPKDELAQKLGYTDYNALVTAATNSSTIISGGFINTSLIQANAILANQINGNGLSVTNGSFSGSISCGTYNSSSQHYPFEVTSNGVLYATGATITGHIEASSGNFGGPNGITIDGNGTVRFGSACYFDSGQGGGGGGSSSSLTPTELIALINQGTTTIDGGRITTGTITAGHINTAGLVVSTVDVKSATSPYNTIAYIGDTSYPIFAGATTAASAPFKVSSSGVLTATGAEISGNIRATSLVLEENVTIDASKITNLPSLNGYIYTDGTIGDTPAEGAIGFVVSSSGRLTASNAVIYGTVYASNGRIGGLTLSNNALSSTNFSLSNTGVLTATGATISGNITASSGSFGGVNGITIGNDGKVYFGSDVVFGSGQGGGSSQLSGNDIIGLINNDNTTTINGGKITTGSITTAHLAANSVTAAKIDTDNLVVKLVDVVNSNSTRIAYMGDTSYPLYIGGTSSSNAAFKVAADGSITIGTNCTISSTGVINAQNATVSGNITANSIDTSILRINGNPVNSSNPLSIRFGNINTTAVSEANTIYFLY